MSNAALGVFVIFGLMLLFELERIRKETTQMRLMMEREEWREACRKIVAISRMMEKEIHNRTDRRLRDELR